MSRRKIRPNKRQPSAKAEIIQRVLDANIVREKLNPADVEHGQIWFSRGEVLRILDDAIDLERERAESLFGATLAKPD